MAMTQLVIDWHFPKNGYSTRL